MKPRPFQRLRLTAQLPQALFLPCCKVCLFIFVWVPTEARGGVLDPLELELPKEGMNCPMWVLGTKLSAEAAVAISSEPISSPADAVEIELRLSSTLLPEAASRGHTWSALVWLLSLARLLWQPNLSIFKARWTGVRHVQLAFWWDLGIGIPIRTDADKLLATEPSSWLCRALYESSGKSLSGG